MCSRLYSHLWWNAKETNYPSNLYTVHKWHKSPVHHAIAQPSCLMETPRLEGPLRPVFFDLALALSSVDLSGKRWKSESVLPLQFTYYISGIYWELMRCSSLAKSVKHGRYIYSWRGLQTNNIFEPGKHYTIMIMIPRMNNEHIPNIYNWKNNLAPASQIRPNVDFTHLRYELLTDPPKTCGMGIHWMRRMGIFESGQSPNTPPVTTPK